jgi:hypothetical protein
VAWVTGQFDAAQAAVDAGDLQGAVEALAPVQAFAGHGMEAWVKGARDRLATDRAVALVGARAAVLAASLY